MRVVVALGGNALLRRGQAMTAENQRENVKTACRAAGSGGRSRTSSWSPTATAPRSACWRCRVRPTRRCPSYPLDVLGAETQGMIGYLVEQELGNLVPFERPVATLLTMIEVDPADPAFKDPTKPIGPIYDQESAEAMAKQRGWIFKADGDYMRRVVPSPKPKRIFELRQVRWLLEQGSVVICAGGGGIPVMYVDRPEPTPYGPEKRARRRRGRHRQGPRLRPCWRRASRPTTSSWPPTPTLSTRLGHARAAAPSPRRIRRRCWSCPTTSPPARCCPRCRRPASSPRQHARQARRHRRTRPTSTRCSGATPGTIVSTEFDGITYR